MYDLSTDRVARMSGEAFELLRCVVRSSSCVVQTMYGMVEFHVEKNLETLSEAFFSTHLGEAFHSKRHEALHELFDDPHKRPTFNTLEMMIFLELTF